MVPERAADLLTIMRVPVFPAPALADEDGMAETLERRIERLEALRDIDALIVDLSRAFDAGPSAEMLRPLFTADAVFRIDHYGTLSGERPSLRLWRAMPIRGSDGPCIIWSRPR